jgi:hypothetical protein
MRREDDQELYTYYYLYLSIGVSFAVISVAEENKVNGFDN